MKKLIILPLFLLALTLGMTAYGEISSSKENFETQDSTANIIAWFNKHDTVTYWINESEWKVTDSDTVKTASVAMKVRVNVVDSTEEGYKMEYSILEIPTDFNPETTTGLEVIQNLIVARFARKIVGTKIYFETDEYGAITKFNNLGQIKKQAKSLYKDFAKMISEFPQAKEMKKNGFDIMAFAKKVDTDQLVEDYLKELNMLFQYQGKVIKLGETTEHEEATDTTYENTTYFSAVVDPEDGSFSIVADVISVIPQDNVKALVGGIVESFGNDSISKNFHESFDAEVNFDANYDDYLSTGILANGWTYSVVHQESTMIGNRGKVKQTVISLDSYSFGN